MLREKADSLKLSLNQLIQKMLTLYKGYSIEKSWEIDSNGRSIKETIRYLAINEDDDWIGDVYRIFKQAYNYIDSIVKSEVFKDETIHSCF